MSLKIAHLSCKLLFCVFSHIILVYECHHAPLFIMFECLYVLYFSCHELCHKWCKFRYLVMTILLTNKQLELELDNLAYRLLASYPLNLEQKNYYWVFRWNRKKTVFGQKTVFGGHFEFSWQNRKLIFLTYIFHHYYRT